MGFQNKFWSLMLLTVCLGAFALPTSANAHETQEMQEVQLVVKNDRLLVSDLNLNRLVEFELDGNEFVVRKGVGNHVVMIVTNKRLIAYSHIGGWKTIKLKINEIVTTMEVVDVSALVDTSSRVISYNGRLGVFKQKK